MKFTVLGAGGFIGGHLLARLRSAGHECLAPVRGDATLFSEELGHVIYCIGLTADFRNRPFDTVRAHVCLLADVLEKARFDSLLYLSSTRVYAGAAHGNEETPLMAGDIYNLSKLTGEALCLASGREQVRIARLSNVYGGDDGSDNFLPSLLRAAVADGRILLHTALDSAKDYVALEDVVEILPKIAMSGKQRIYNVASGRNTSNRGLVENIRALTGCVVGVLENAPLTSFPQMDIARLRSEFQFEPRQVMDGLSSFFDNMGKVSHG